MNSISSDDVKAIHRAELTRIQSRPTGQTIRRAEMVDGAWKEVSPVVVPPHDEKEALQAEVDALQDQGPEVPGDPNSAALHKVHLDRAATKVAQWSPESEARTALRTMVHVRLHELNPAMDADSLPDALKGTHFATDGVISEVQKAHHQDLWDETDRAIAEAFGEPTPAPAPCKPGGAMAAGKMRMSNTLRSVAPPGSAAGTTVVTGGSK